MITVTATSGVRDLSDNALADFTSTFTTTTAIDSGRPSVVGQRPGNGASGVAAAIPLVLFLNERLDPATAAGALHVSQNGAVVDGTVTVGGDGQVLQFEPAAPWTGNALIQVFLDGSATDLNGNSVNPYQSSFRTAPDPVTAAPVVTATSPSYGATVPLNVAITHRLQRAARCGIGELDHGAALGPRLVSWPRR